ncbi:MAG: hypothetical protein HZA94_00940 [Candidatus Vogelbacteria bacterium]|nr:hypothetical protein [Candidatus Vogelbacteria bacterium]
MKTIFAKNSEYDARVMWSMLKSLDPAGVVNRARTMKIGDELLTMISTVQNYEEAKDAIEKVVWERHADEEQITDKAVSDYQKTWDEINDIFYNEVENITGVPWEFSEYRVVVSPFHRGISNRGKNVVACDAYEDPNAQKRKIAHEILMVQMWYIFDSKYLESKEGSSWGSLFGHLTK